MNAPTMCSRTLHVPKLMGVLAFALASGALSTGPLRALDPATLVGTVDYSDTFTLGPNGRANGVFGAGAIAAFAVEDTHGNNPSTWTPQTNFSFNDVSGSFGAGPVVLATATGNPGAHGGLAQSGGGDFSFAYGLRTNYVVQMDAFVSPGDRTDISSLPAPGDTIFAANSLSVFFRRDSIGANSLGLFNGAVESHVLDDMGNRVLIGVDNDNWHNLAVQFNQDDDRLVIWVDGDMKADLDLTTFAGGIYQNYSNGAVGAGGAGAFVRDTVLWFDNFRVGAPSRAVFSDDFARPDGPIDGWTVFRGDWRLEGERLVTGPTAAEHWIWAGDPAVTIPENTVIEFDIEFLAPGTNATVGRHAGAMFCSNEATERLSATSNGYVLWWIDRASDFGLSLARFDGAAFTFLHEGTFGAVAQPPGRWRIEVQGPGIKIYGDDVLYIDVVDSTYRGGHCGLWAWSGGEHVAFDNFVVAEPESGAAVACFNFDSTPAVPTTVLGFDASCSQSVGGGEIISWEWDFGDGDTDSGELVTHAWSAGGIFTVTLTVMDEAGNVGETTADVLIGDPTIAYVEDFERPDGPVDEWTSAAGVWSLGGGRLVTGPTAAEHWIWAGDTPRFAPSQTVFEFDYVFEAPGTVPAVGRHGGFQFHCTRPTVRSGGTAFSGYFIDWIDRPADRGVRLTRVDNGAFVGLGLGQGAAAPAEPPTRYRVEVEGESIRVFGDDVLYVDVRDGTYRGGFFGFWAWSGGEQVAIDNVAVNGERLEPCFELTPARPIAGEAVTFDARCSGVFAGLEPGLVSFNWDFGDGTTDEGEVVEHVFALADVYTVTLTVTDGDGAMKSVDAVVTAAPSLDPFADCFDRKAGPVDGWTSVLGDWSISENGRLQVSTTTGAPDGEAWIYPGDPAGLLRGDAVVEFDLPSVLFTGAPGDAVGRHFGVYLFGNTTTTNRFAGDSSGYTFWWIDREIDFGLSLARWDGPALTLLHTGTFDLVADPPLTWRIEVEGENIRLFGDGVLYIDVADSTYREGNFAFWTWKNISLQVDNFRIPPTQAPRTCDVALVCEVVEGESPMVRIQGSVSAPDFCGAPEVCECDEVEITVGGESGRSVAVVDGAFSVDAALPAGCEPGTEIVVAARCLVGGEPGAEGTCTVICPEPPGGLRIAGDCNEDGDLSIADASCLLGYLFRGTTPRLPCGDGTIGDPATMTLLDVNGSAELDVSDGAYILNFIFMAGPPPVLGEECVRIVGCDDACTP